MNSCIQRLNNIYLMLAASLFLVLASCGEKASNSDGTYTLTLNLPVGERYYYTTEMKQDVSSAGMQMHQDMLFGMVYEMLEPQGELKRMQVTYDHLKLKAESPMGTMEYDTRQPSPSSPFAAFQDIIGKTLQVDFTADGRIERVSGMEDLLPDNVSQALSDSSLTKMVTNSFNFFPGEPVAVGDSWKKAASMNINGLALQVESTYTLVAVKETIATIKVRADISMPDGSRTDQEMQISLKGTQEGEIRLDIDKGLVVSGTIDQTIQGELQAGGQKMPMEITSDILFSTRKMQ